MYRFSYTNLSSRSLWESSGTFKPMSRPNVAAMFAMEIIRCGSKLLPGAAKKTRSKMLGCHFFTVLTRKYKNIKEYTAGWGPIVS